MKRTLLSLTVLLLSLSIFGQSKSDTIAIDQSIVSKWITDTTTNSKGKEYIKYYAVYKGQLVSTNKATIQAVNLCNKHKVKCALILITSGKGKKRIVCN